MQEELPHDACLDNVQEKILILLAQHDRLDAGQISSLMRTGVRFSLLHLGELKKAGMVKDCEPGGDTASWKLLQAGQAYLAHHGMIF